VAAERRPRLTPKIRRLVTPDRLAPPPVGRLTEAHVEALSAVATRPEQFEELVSAPRAIQALAAGASPQVAIPVLQSVLASRRASSTDRVVAARELGTIATPEARSALLRRVRDSDPRVQQAVFAALGIFAGPEVLRSLAGVREPEDFAARRQLAFTRALIAHRYGLDGPFLPEARGMPRRRGSPREMITLTLRPRTPRATAADMERHLGPTYGIKFAERGYELRAGRAEWAVFVNREMTRSITSLERFFERPWIAAVLGRWFPERFANTTQYLVLTRPVDGSARIDVVRTDGEVMYTGTAEQIGEAISFAMADVDRPGTAPTNVRGRVGPEGLELDVTIPFGTRTGTQSTEPVIVPEP
jgi:hypothetical protein